MPAHLWFSPDTTLCLLQRPWGYEGEEGQRVGGLWLQLLTMLLPDILSLME